MRAKRGSGAMAAHRLTRRGAADSAAISEFTAEQFNAEQACRRLGTSSADPNLPTSRPHRPRLEAEAHDIHKIRARGRAVGVWMPPRMCQRRVPLHVGSFVRRFGAFPADDPRLPGTPTLGPSPPMPRLVPGGPDVPPELIQKQEAGEMVFFCGAGISVPTGLPSFPGLVQQLYSRLNTSPTPSEERALSRSEFDTALDSLEERFHPGALREEVAQLLSVAPNPGSLRLHRALLGVARTASGVHLVTTNYDDNFAHADDTDELQYDVGPNVPKDLDNWNSVVHLHGRIRAWASGSAIPPLVLTDTDFGEAYLRTRWAADFVLHLMDRYTVVFVGYSMADVVVRYLTKAVSGRRAKHRIYSLVGYADQTQREQRASQWQDHRIQPILYDSRDTHELLVSSVEEWAKLAQDPHGYRVRLAVSGLSKMPDRKTHGADPDRVVWALLRCGRRLAGV